MSPRIPLPETDLPGLAPLVNGSLWDQWNNEGRVFPLGDRREMFRYIRLKPGTSCRLTVFDRKSEDDFPPRGFRVDLYAEPERARMAFGKERGGFVDVENLAVVTPFPNDPKIPELRHCYRSYRLRCIVGAVLEERYPAGRWRIRRRGLLTRLLAYKPGRRAVLRVDVELVRDDGDHAKTSVVLKLTETGRALPLHLKLAALETSTSMAGHLHRPRPLAFIDGRELVALEYARGTPLRELSPSSWPEPLRQVGRSVARLHRVEPQTVAGLDSAADRRSIDELAADYIRLAPFASRRLDEVRRALRDVGSTEHCLIHGDLHASQILADPDGARLIDWDQAGWGPALRDVGGFLAHLEVIDAQPSGAAFLQGYADEAGSLPPRAELRRWTARMLFLRLGDPFRRLRPDWPERTLALLDRIETLLDQRVTAT